MLPNCFLKNNVFFFRSSRISVFCFIKFRFLYTFFFSSFYLFFGRHLLLWLLNTSSRKREKEKKERTTTHEENRKEKAESKKVFVFFFVQRPLFGKFTFFSSFITHAIETILAETPKWQEGIYNSLSFFFGKGFFSSSNCFFLSSSSLARPPALLY